jgi:predicted RNase H-like nuclease (RuvC/YqgF family)
MAEKKGDLLNNSGGSIEQIREIIFGDQMIEFDRQIKELKKECTQFKNKINDLEKKDAEFDQLMAETKEKQKASASDQQRIHEIIEKLKKEFDKKIAELKDAKVDKSQIGQAFIDWGMKVKQTANNKS